MGKSVYSILLTALILLGVLSGCATASASDAPSIVVGGKGFTEAFLMSELYALAAEDAGYRVERMYGISALHEAIVAGEVDVYPEYTGTGLLNVLQEPSMTDPQAVYDRVKERYQELYDLVWLDSSQLNDSTCIVMRTEQAEELGIQNLSDLREEAPNLKLADFSGWSEREDNLIAMNKLYGEFAFNELVQIDSGLKYAALEADQVQVIPGLTTEPQLLGGAFVIIEEDIKVWPPYYLAPVIRQEVLSAYPNLEEIFNKVSAAVDNDAIIELISRVDIDGEEYEDVAKDFYESRIQ